MVGKKENIRNYEVSIWTLQDSFITVLKPLNLEHKGAIQDGKITLKDDGENTISFSIPMYIREKGEFIENPLWYNRQEGFLIANLRKLKVIFNKHTDYEEVFEFLITKVIDKHEGFSKICEIEGEGLAFNELGKQGYKISLSPEDLWNTETGETFNNNINYWCNKVFKNSNWHYSIQMDWSAFDGIIFSHDNYNSYEDMPESERDSYNKNYRAGAQLRRCDKIYEDAYVASWVINPDTGKLIPNILEKEKEKFRTINSSESNRYNLIQTIAETFGVFAKFKYYYDDNYHIIDREVIFYNNFLNEVGEVIDLNFNYETQSISRELDANDLVTKMYVKELDDDNSPSGKVSISETEANKSGEDYILNFDYLYETNTISKEQYQAVEEFENKIGSLNKEIFVLQKEIQTLEDEKWKLEAERDNASVKIGESQDQLNQMEARKTALGMQNEATASITNPAILVLVKEDNKYSSNFPSKYEGIDSTSICLYQNFKYDNGGIRKVCDELDIPYNFEENDDIRKIEFSSNELTLDKDIIYATFNYNPLATYEKNYQIYLNLNAEQTALYNAKQDAINIKINSLKQKKENLDNKIHEKEKILVDFENLMGPALREGTWQPEDEYTKYGEKHSKDIALNLTYENPNNNELLNFVWDTELEDDEEKNYYKSGVNLKKVYYPCIDLTDTSLLLDLAEKSFIQNLVFSYRETSNIKALRTSSIGGDCRLAFIKNGNTIKPVLLLLNLQDYEKEENSSSNPDFSKISYPAISYLSLEKLMGEDNLTNWNEIISDSKIFQVNSSGSSNPAWIADSSIYQSVYPRIVINSDYLKTGTNDIVIILNDTENNIYKCELYEDYYIIKKDSKTYITLKPETLFKSGIIRKKTDDNETPLHIKINYIIDDNALHVYLDAKEIMKENAYPKVSYNINALSTNTNLTYNIYNRLGQLAHINDPELKLNNVMGYISAVDLNLDKPWEDSITIQNYKNKFEDLFSSIVAQTEEMKKNTSKIEVVMSGFNTDGQISEISLDKSKSRLDDLIQRNNTVIVANTTSIAAANKAYLASTDTYRVMNGEVGIAFKSDMIDNLEINKMKGLLIEGIISEDSDGTPVKGFFNVTNGSMGFFKGTYNNPDEAMLFFRDGDLGISGNIYAKHGWFGGEDGWIIGKGDFSFNQGSNIKKSEDLVTKIKNINSDKYGSLTTSVLGGLLFSANGKAIFTAGDDEGHPPMIVLSKDGFDSLDSGNIQSDNTLLLFDGDRLYINGEINAGSGNIGGWTIGSDYIGNGSTKNQSTAGICSTDNNNEKVFWAGGTYDGTPSFYVQKNGYLYSTKGKIGGWFIGSNYLGTGETLGGSKVGISNRNAAGNYVFWAGGEKDPNDANSLKTAVFSVTVEGKLTSTSGSIGGWNIGSNYLGTGETLGGSAVGISNRDNDNYVFWAGGVQDTADTLKSAVFSVTAKGKLTATEADITGIIKANEGYIGGTNGWQIITNAIYNGTNSLESTNPGLYLGTDGILAYSNTAHVKITNGKITAAGADISGTIKATSGNIGGNGGWVIDSGKIYYSSSTPGATGALILSIGTSSINSIAGSSQNLMWMISAGQNFGVTTGGILYANSANIKGNITATTLSVGTGGHFLTYENGELTVQGNVTANKVTANISINSPSISSGTIEGGTIKGGTITGTEIKTSNNSFHVSSTGDLTAHSVTITGGNQDFDDIDSAGFSLEKNIIKAKKVEISGKITATSGKIGGWTIGSNFIGSGTTRGNSAVGMSNYTNDVNDDSKLVFWAGNPNTTNTGTSLTTKDIPFSVTRAGVLRASGAIISGATQITGTTSINTSGPINLTSGNVSLTLNPAFQNGIGGNVGADNVILKSFAENNTFSTSLIMNNEEICLKIYNSYSKSTGILKLMKSRYNYGNNSSVNLVSQTAGTNQTVGYASLNISDFNSIVIENINRINIGSSQNRVYLNAILNGNISLNGTSIISNLCSASSSDVTYKIIVSTGNTIPAIPDYVDRVLWIKPGSTTTPETGDLKYRSCEVYWVMPKTS